MSNLNLHTLKQDRRNDTPDPRPVYRLLQAMRGYMLPVISVAALALALAAFLVSRTAPKVAYVRSTELVYGYIGMKEAHTLFERKKQVWQSELDSLQQVYTHEAEAFDRERAALSNAEQMRRTGLLEQQQQYLMKRREELDAQAQEHDRNLTQGVLNQINGAARDYGASHGYDLVLSTSTAGNILYGAEQVDITSEVLEVANRAYALSGTVVDTSHHE